MPENLAHVRAALDAEADIVVAQGFGGRRMTAPDRGTFTLVPGVAAMLARTCTRHTARRRRADVADGRGLAAALALGADGVLIGTRLGASQESLVKPLHERAIVESDGDGTLRTHLPEIMRELPWPQGVHPSASERWRMRLVNRGEGQESELDQQAAVAAAGVYSARPVADGDPENTAVRFGEAAGLIDTIEPAATIIERMVTDAVELAEGRGLGGRLTDGLDFVA